MVRLEVVSPPHAELIFSLCLLSAPALPDMCLSRSTFQLPIFAFSTLARAFAKYDQHEPDHGQPFYVWICRVRRDRVQTRIIRDDEPHEHEQDDEEDGDTLAGTRNKHDGLYGSVYRDPDPSRLSRPHTLLLFDVRCMLPIWFACVDQSVKCHSSTRLSRAQPCVGRGVGHQDGSNGSDVSGEVDAAHGASHSGGSGGSASSSSPSQRARIRRIQVKALARHFRTERNPTTYE